MEVSDCKQHRCTKQEACQYQPRTGKYRIGSQLIPCKIFLWAPKEIPELGTTSSVQINAGHKQKFHCRVSSNMQITNARGRHTPTHTFVQLSLQCHSLGVLLHLGSCVTGSRSPCALTAETSGSGLSSIQTQTAIVYIPSQHPTLPCIVSTCAL